MVNAVGMVVFFASWVVGLTLALFAANRVLTTASPGAGTSALLLGTVLAGGIFIWIPVLPFMLALWVTGS